jgi:hypothetical protein
MKRTASIALRYLMVSDADNGIPKVVIYDNTPQWVADLINRTKNREGITDQLRQLMVVDSLRDIVNGRRPEPATDKKYLDVYKRHVWGARLDYAHQTKSVTEAELKERNEVFNLVENLLIGV